MADRYALVTGVRAPCAGRGHRPVKGNLHATFRADRDAVAGARRILLGWLESCSAGDWPTDDIALAVTEACGNAVQHAYRHGEPGPVELSAAIDDEGLSVTVADAGVGMRPRIDSPGCGLGLMIMSSLAASVRVDATPAGTEVRMTFRRTRRDERYASLGRQPSAAAVAEPAGRLPSPIAAT